MTLSLADTHGSYCYRHTGKEWPNTHTCTYEDTHTKKIKKHGSRTKNPKGVQKETRKQKIKKNWEKK